jgi:hypothetical protein
VRRRTGAAARSCGLLAAPCGPSRGGGKVVPDAEVLERHGRRLIERRLMLARIAPLIEEVESEAARVTLPDDLAELVEQELERTPELAWEEALERVLADVTPEADA